MHPIEIKQCLESMVILVDTREQPSARARKRYEQFKCEYRRQKLDFCDYSAEFTDTNGVKHLLPVGIERKESLAELSGNLCQNHERFAREFDRAKEAGYSVYLLVEDATWENILNGRYGTKFHPNAYEASLLAFISRYDIKPIFCKKEVSGRLIHDILHRELKERLENGFYG